MGAAAFVIFSFLTRGLVEGKVNISQVKGQFNRKRRAIRSGRTLNESLINSLWKRRFKNKTKKKKNEIYLFFKTLKWLCCQSFCTRFLILIVSGNVSNQMGGVDLKTKLGEIRDKLHK